MSPVIGMAIEMDSTLPVRRGSLIEWVRHHSMVASLLPFGFTELFTKSGVMRILQSRDFWQEWLFEEFVLPDFKFSGLLTHLIQLFT
jgi:hypothetical protein